METTIIIYTIIATLFVVGIFFYFRLLKHVKLLNEKQQSILASLNPNVSIPSNVAESPIATPIVPTVILESVEKIVENQASKIKELEEKIQLYKREDVGVVAEWASPREDKSAYLLNIYNDTAERIFNVQVEIEPLYRNLCKLYGKEDKCDPQKSINAFFVPGGWSDPSISGQKPVDRADFVKTWTDNNFLPIKFNVTYTKTPSRQNYEMFEVSFTIENTTKHLKSRLIAKKPILTSVSNRIGID
jgi:hypothetical protein